MFETLGTLYALVVGIVPAAEFRSSLSLEQKSLPVIVGANTDGVIFQIVVSITKGPFHHF